MKRPAPQKYLWAFHLLRCSLADRCPRGKNISEFLSSLKPCKLSERGSWFQRTTQNSLYGAPGKMTPFFQVKGMAIVTTACLITCSLILSHKKKGTGLYLTGLLYLSTQASQRGTKPNVCDCLQKRSHTTDKCADHDRASMATFLHRLSGEAQWCSTHTGLLSPATHLLKPKWLHSSFCSASVVGKKPLPMTYESGYFSSLIWVWAGLAKSSLRCAALFPLLLWGLNRLN